MRVPSDGILSVGWQPAGEALFMELGKELKIVDMIMLGWFIQESRSSIDRGGIRHIALAVYTRIGLADVLGSFSFSVPPYIIRFLA